MTTDDPTSGQDMGQGEHLYFRVVVANPSQKKHVKTSLGVGGRFHQGQVLLTLHKRLRGFTEHTVVADVASSSSSADAIFVADDWSAAPEVLKADVQGYAKTSIRWTLPTFVPPLGYSDKDVCELMERFMSTGSHFGGRAGSSLGVSAADGGLVRALQSASYCRAVDDGARFVLTEEGTRSLAACSQLDEPFKVQGSHLTVPLVRLLSLGRPVSLHK